MLSKSKEELIGQNCSAWCSIICYTNNCGIACLKRGVSRTTFHQGELDYQVDVAFLLDLNQNNCGYVEIVQDISNLKDLTIKSQTDLLSMLYNKISTHELIEELIKNNKNEYHAFILLDIDNFKNINDTYGHAFGDDVIVHIGAQLKALFRSCDIIGRTGGDEFIIFIPQMSNIEDLVSKANIILKAFNSFYIDDNYNCKITLSMGIEHAKDADFETYYKNADIALYKAKKMGKNTYCIYGQS